MTVSMAGRMDGGVGVLTFTPVEAIAVSRGLGTGGYEVQWEKRTREVRFEASDEV